MAEAPYVRAGRRPRPGPRDAATTAAGRARPGVHAAPARTLLVVPVVHTGADLGGLAGAVERVTVEKLGRQAWQRNVRLVEEMWRQIRTAVEGLALPWDRVRLYQDGLPKCGREAEIVRELAAAGSANHALLADLMARGATLMGTESGELVVRELRLMQKVLAATDPQEAATLQARHAAESRALLDARDRFMARRISETLAPGETGILFVGMLHSLEPHLAPDIHVAYPVHRPPRRTERTQA